MKFTYLLGLSLLMFSFISCGNETKKQTEEPEIEVVETTQTKEYTSSDAEVAFKDEKVGEAYHKYIAVKTALVNTDATATATAASDLMTAFANVGVEEEVLTATQNISETEDVEIQRQAFVDVTAAMEAMLDGALESGTIYKQYCPMAFDFTGASWLSSSKEILNPYFGDKMLRCGKVQAEIE
ncbi:MAG: DUF3347 domain-containing protein [Flavobacteriaceae bacterium]|nr:DUF3347 domain-containing protein [Flavobacteriaceae bacterium]